MGVVGLGMAGPTIMAHGTRAEERYLAKILSAEEIWCQGFSEPAPAPTSRAVRTRYPTTREDHFVLNGQKVWSSFAHIADFCILVGAQRPGGRSDTRGSRT